MLDGCPNFHRIIDKKITKKYSTYAIKHVYLFYNWNIRTKLEKKLKDSVYKHWRYIKFLSGNNYTISDIATFPWIARHEWHDIGLSQFKNLTRWYNEISRRDAVIKGFSFMNKSELPPKA